MSDVANAPLSMDEGLALLADAGHGEREPEEAAPEAPPEQAPESQGDDAEAAPEEPASEDGEPEGEEPAPPAIDPPSTWDAAAKERFSKLDPETQQFLAEQDAVARSAIGKKLEETSAARKAAEAETAKARQLNDDLEKLIPSVQERFKSKWENATPEAWAAWAKQDPEAAFQAKAEYDADVAQMQRLTAAKQDAEKTAHQAFVSEQLPKMASLIPGLGKPETAQPYMDKMMAYARQHGATDQQLNWARAEEWALIDKARLWDESQAKLKSQPVTRAPAAATARPAAAQIAQAPQQRRVQDLRASLKQSGRVEDALALIEAQGL